MDRASRVLAAGAALAAGRDRGAGGGAVRPVRGRVCSAGGRRWRPRCGLPSPRPAACRSPSRAAVVALRYRRTAWFAGTALGALTVAASVFAGLLGPVAIAVCACCSAGRSGSHGGGLRFTAAQRAAGRQRSRRTVAAEQDGSTVISDFDGARSAGSSANSGLAPSVKRFQSSSLMRPGRDRGAGDAAFTLIDDPMVQRVLVAKRIMEERAHMHGSPVAGSIR